jgi:hypothetical protein
MSELKILAKVRAKATVQKYLNEISALEAETIRTLNEIVQPNWAKCLKDETHLVGSAYWAAHEHGLQIPALEIFLKDYLAAIRQALELLVEKIRGLYEPY